MQINTDDLKWKVKNAWNAFKRKVSYCLARVWDFVCNNLGTIVTLLPLVIALIKTLGNMILKQNAGKKAIEAALEEDIHRRRDVYDRRNGYTIRCNRDLTNADRVVIDRRRRDGETITEILRDMGLL